MFNQDKLLSLLAELNNEKNEVYHDLLNCLEDDRRKKMPSDFLPYRDIEPKEIVSLMNYDIDRLDVLRDRTSPWWKRMLWK